MTEREALKLALEALDGLSEPYDVLKAQEAIREALAQPEDPCKGANYSQASEQEPVVWMYQDKISHAVKFQRHMSDFVDHSRFYETPLYTTPPQPEPVIDKSAAIRIATSLGWEPKRTWVGLTDEDIDIAFDDTQEGGGFWEFARAIEAKLKEKNT